MKRVDQQYLKHMNNSEEVVSQRTSFPFLFDMAPGPRIRFMEIRIRIQSKIEKKKLFFLLITQKNFTPI